MLDTLSPLRTTLQRWPRAAASASLRAVSCVRVSACVRGRGGRLAPPAPTLTAALTKVTSRMAPRHQCAHGTHDGTLPASAT